MGVLYNRLCFPLFCLWRYRSSSRHCYPCRLCSSVTLNFLRVPPSVPPCRSDVSLFEKLKKTSSSGRFSDCVYLHSRVCVCVCAQVWGTSRISEQTEADEAPNGNQLSSFPCRQTSLCETHTTRRFPRWTDTTNEAKNSLHKYLNSYIKLSNYLFSI